MDSRNRALEMLGSVMRSTALGPKAPGGCAQLIKAQVRGNISHFITGVTAESARPTITITELPTLTCCGKVTYQHRKIGWIYTIFSRWEKILSTSQHCSVMILFRTLLKWPINNVRVTIFIQHIYDIF